MEDIQKDAQIIRDAQYPRQYAENNETNLIGIDFHPVDTDKLKQNLNIKIKNKLNELNGMLVKLARVFTKESETDKNKRIEEIAKLLELQKEFGLVGGNNKTKGGKRKTRRNLKKNKKSKRKTSHRRH